MMPTLRFFRPEVEVALKVAFVAALASVYLVTFAWGYEGQYQARRWREIACSARLSELERTTPGTAIRTGSPCDTLDRAGIAVVIAR